jgi:hypothetical protein
VEDVGPAGRHKGVEQRVGDALHHRAQLLHPRGVNALDTSRRIRVCAGGSAYTRVSPSPIALDAISRRTARTPSLAFALSAEIRGSEYTACASAKRVTSHAGNPW